MERIRNEMYGGKLKRLDYILFWLTNPRFVDDSVPKQVCAEDVVFALEYKKVSADTNSRSALVLALTGRYLSDYEAVYSTGVPQLGRKIANSGYDYIYDGNEWHFMNNEKITQMVCDFMREDDLVL